MSVVACGRVIAAAKHHVEARVPSARVGDRVRIYAHDRKVEASIAALNHDRVVLALVGDAERVACGDRVEVESGSRLAVLGSALLGRAIDGCGVPFDGGPPPAGVAVRIDDGRLAPGERALTRGPLWTGARAVDAFATLARGARLGIFGAAGTGKSVLLEQIARHATADAIVLALIGERGGEARRDLAKLDRRTTIVCAPSDRSAAEKLAAGDLALAQAEELRRRGLDVLVVFDSVMRYAQAVREVALAGGEPAGRGGYPASVFARLAGLVERGGCTRRGSITILATVLCDPLDPGDVLAEAARSLLDGHIVLSRALAERGRFPAVDVTASLSRTMVTVVTPGHIRDAARVRTAIARLEATRDGRELGIVPTDAAFERVLAAEAAIEDFLRQAEEGSGPEETLRALRALADTL